MTYALLSVVHSRLSYIYIYIYIFFFFDISTQGNGEERFELVTSASLGMVHNRLSYYSLGTRDLCIIDKLS
jgi:hypothetical protein